MALGFLFFTILKFVSNLPVTSNPLRSVSGSVSCKYQRIKRAGFSPFGGEKRKSLHDKTINFPCFPFFTFHQFAIIRHGDWAFSPITYPPIGLSCRSTGNLIFSHAKTAEPDPILSDGTTVFCQTSCDFALSGLCFPRQKLLPIHWWMRQPSTAGQWADHHAGITAKTKQHPIFVLPFFSLLL